MICLVCREPARIHVLLAKSNMDRPRDGAYLGDSFCSRRCLRRAAKKGTSFARHMDRRGL